MSDWGVGGGGVLTPTDSISSTSLVVAVTPGAGSKGSYAELISAANNRDGDWNGFWIFLKKNGSGMNNHAVDFAVGAGGSEQVVMADFKYSAKNTVGTTGIFVPLRIPGGTRVSCAIASAGTETIEVQAVGVAGAFSSLPAFGNMDAMGITVSNGDGVDIDPGGTINTKGAYSQIIASTLHHYKHLIVCIGNSDNQGGTLTHHLMDFAVGAASSEQIFAADIAAVASPQELIIPQLQSFPVDIQQGARIAVRTQCTITDATDRLLDIAIMGFY